MARPQRIVPGPGQESVWDYPRPPRLDSTDKHVQIVFDGLTIADTRRAIRVLETSSPPVYYIPSVDIQMEHLQPTERRTVCEWKGHATNWTVTHDDRTAPNAAWSYPHPTAGFQAIVDHLAFYPGKMDACLVDGEPVRAQPGDFYGGWITPDIVGTFKGDPGSEGW